MANFAIRPAAHVTCGLGAGPALEVLEVFGGQFRQYRGVNRVVAERLLVLLHPEPVEPCRNVHARLPAGSAPPRLPYRDWRLRINAPGHSSQHRAATGRPDALPLPMTS